MGFDGSLRPAAPKGESYKGLLSLAKTHAAAAGQVAATKGTCKRCGAAGPGWVNLPNAVARGGGGTIQKPAYPCPPTAFFESRNTQPRHSSVREMWHPPKALWARNWGTSFVNNTTPSKRCCRMQLQSGF